MREPFYVKPLRGITKGNEDAFRGSKDPLVLVKSRQPGKRGTQGKMLSITSLVALAR